MKLEAGQNDSSVEVTKRHPDNDLKLPRFPMNLTYNYGVDATTTSKGSPC